MRDTLRTLCAVVIGLVFLAVAARANPVTFRYQNPGTVPYDTVVVHVPNLAPFVRASACPPGLICNVTIPLAPGFYQGVYLTGRAGTQESVASNLRDYIVRVAVPCDFDYDGSGTLTTLDYGIWLADYTQGYWTTADFATFLSRLGKTCRVP